MNGILRQSRNGVGFFGTALLGCALSFALYQTWQLETRWAAVVCIAIVSVSIAMCLVRIFSEFLLIGLLFCLPFATGTKWFFPAGFGWQEQASLAFAGVFNIGLLDFFLVGLYMSWLYRIFVSREQQPPRLYLLDALILWYVLADLLATIGSQNVTAGLGSTEYLLKYVLFYFYLSRHLEERHLPWLVAAFGFAIILDAALGSFQFATGRLVGIALDKGAGSFVIDSQYSVPGVENYSRATGTSYDSHTFGEFVGALLPFALVLFFTPRLRPALRLGCLAASGCATLGVLLSLSRTGWVASALALMIGIVLIVGVWRERQVVPALAAVVMAVAVVAPLVGHFAYERFANSPIGTVTDRLDQFAVAWHVVTLHPAFGVGPANYTLALRQYDYLGLEPVPVHNSLLWLATEIGIFGLTAYLGTLTTAAWQLFSLARRRRDVTGRLALAAFLGLITIALNDQFNAGFREPNVFAMFWLLVSLSVALPRLRPGAGAILMAPAQPVRGVTAAQRIGAYEQSSSNR